MIRTLRPGCLYIGWCTGLHHECFENGASSAGMLPAQPGIQPVSERGFRLRTKWGGLAYSGLEWTWTARNGAEVRVAEADLKQAAESQWRYTDIPFGQFQNLAVDVAVPMFGVDASNRPAFRVITVKGPRPGRMVSECGISDECRERRANRYQ